MVFAPVDPATKEKVIASYLAGKDRNRIDREFQSAGIKVSHGSISNIINTYKREHEQPLQPESSDTGLNNTDFPLLSKHLEMGDHCLIS